MPRRLPNFSALRAFEAAARHENFSRAAAELQLTHGAISHQVRALEQELGQALFVRHGRQVKITHEGLQFAQLLGKAFADIGAATDAMRASKRAQRLTIAALPAFAARWLTPRLGGFIERHPEIEVVLQAGSQAQDLARAGIDVAIRYGAGPYPGLTAVPLMTELLYPVVSPHYRPGRLPATPQELVQHTLLRSPEAWTPWLRAAGLDWPEPADGPWLEDGSLLLRAAVAGEGVALGRHVMVLPDIRSGQLRRLFDVAAPSAQAYYLVAPPGAAGTPQVRAFRRWLEDEVTAFQR